MVGVGKLADCKKLSRTGAEDTKLTLNTCSLHLRSLCLCLCLIFLVFVGSLCFANVLMSCCVKTEACLEIDVDL